MAQAQNGMLESRTRRPEGTSKENGGVGGGPDSAVPTPSLSAAPGTSRALGWIGNGMKDVTGPKTSGIPTFKQIAESKSANVPSLMSTSSVTKEEGSGHSTSALVVSGNDGGSGSCSTTAGTQAESLCGSGAQAMTAAPTVAPNSCRDINKSASQQKMTLAAPSTGKSLKAQQVLSHSSVVRRGAGGAQAASSVPQPGLDAIVSAAESVHNARHSSKRAPAAAPVTAPEQARIPVPTMIEVTQRSTHRPTSHGFRTTDPHHQSNSQILAPRAGPLLLPSNAPHTKNKPTALRRGKWTVEEEAYVARVIQDFNSGFLNAPAGTTLRSYLSEKLHCDPMRITKKFTGDACIGKRVFHPAVRCPSNAAAIDKAQAELDALERRWRRRLEMQQRESAKKAAASAAAAAAAAACGHPPYQAPPAVAEHAIGGTQMKQVAITRTASWLDRANAILARQQLPRNDQPVPGPAQDIQHQMEEVKRLIHEGPIIQQTTAGLTHMIDHGTSSNYPISTTPTSGNGGRPHSPDTPSRQQQSDKRPRRLADDAGAADAEALLGFLNSVRAHTAEPVASQQGGGN